MLDMAEQLETIEPTELIGSVVSTVGMTISAAGFPAPLGAVAEIQREPEEPLLAEVIGFRDALTLLLPLSHASGIRHGNRIRLKRTTRWLRVGDGLLVGADPAAGRGRPREVGRVLDRDRERLQASGRLRQEEIHEVPL